MSRYYEESEYYPGRVIVACGKNAANGMMPFDMQLNGLEIEGVEILHHANSPSVKSSQLPRSGEDYEILLIKLKSKNKQTVMDAIDVLTQNPNVLYAEPDCLMQLDIIPDDPYFNTLWGMRKINAPHAWNKFTGSSDVLVGVIDSGIDYNHPDLKDNMWVDQSREATFGWDFFYDDYDPRDMNSHGTHVAGTIGATGNNDIGVAGVNWRVKMAALKITGDSSAVSVSAAIKAIEYAIEKDMPILNNSWGGRNYCESLKFTIEQYKGLLIASAGNNGTDNDVYPHYPSSYDCDNIISVAASCEHDQLASFSNYGATTVHIAAPGAEIYSPVLHYAYGFKSGTSMAAPHVAGAAALLKGYRPDLTTLEIKDIILSSADKIPSLYGRVLTGGKLNINAMLEMAGPVPVTMAGHPLSANRRAFRY